MRDFVAVIGYYIINIVLFPVTLAGYVMWIGQGVLAKAPSGVSGTAQGPLSVRWTMHNLGVRQDEAANLLLPIIPSIPPAAFHMTGLAMLLGHRATGYVPKAFRYPFEGEVPKQYEASARVAFFDNAVETYLSQVDQLVVLGAGFDTRPYGLPRDTRVRSFEVDTPKTQEVKRDLLAKAGIDSSQVTFVPADFETDDWLARLVDAGFDLSKPALFIWEGVIIYLDQAAVEDTLRKIGGTAKGSVLAFDYFTSESLESQAAYWRFARASTKAAGEPLKYGIDATPPSRERVAELLRSCGLTLTEQTTLGSESGTQRAWGGFAVATVE